MTIFLLYTNASSLPWCYVEDPGNEQGSVPKAQILKLNLRKRLLGLVLSPFEGSIKLNGSNAWISCSIGAYFAVQKEVYSQFYSFLLDASTVFRIVLQCSSTGLVLLLDYN